MRPPQASDPSPLQPLLHSSGATACSSRKLSTRCITADDGIIQVSVNSAESRIDNLDKRIARAELSIERNIERYRSQFAQLDGMIAQMNSTSAYLSQQFSMLSAMQSGN